MNTETLPVETFKTVADWVRALDSVNTWSNAADHRQADAIIVAYLRANGGEAIADAWERARARCDFWYD